MKELPRNRNGKVARGVRTCVGCRRRRDPAELVRVVRTASGALSAGAHLPGRGAWLCRSDEGLIAPECLEAARRKDAFTRALRAPVTAAAVEALRPEGTKRATIEDGRA